jgi:general secretion pathway protein G
VNATRKSLLSSIAKIAAMFLLSLLLAYVIMPHIGSDHGVARPAAARADISTLGTALDAFQMDCERFPTTAEGLNAMISQPTNLPGWRGPYLKDCPAPPLDPWGHPYVYICPGVHNPKTFDLYSCGRDGVSRTGGDDPDDINNWTSPHQH